MKKILCLIILVLMISVVFNYSVCYGQEQLTLSSESAVLMDYDSGTIVCQKNQNKHLPIASMTKIMLLDLCFNEYGQGKFDLSDEIIVSENASGMGGSQVFLEGNKPYQIGELIKSIIVASANDASVAMAEFLYGSEENCVNYMNLRAKELNMNDTVYKNCTGLPHVGQFSCASDVAKVFKDLLSYKEYYEYTTIWLDEIKHCDGRTTTITNTNKLIRSYDGCDAGKTGYTSESGYCISASAKRGNMRLISVVIKANTSKERFLDVTNMFDYGFNNYVNKVVVNTEKPINVEYSINNGKGNIELYAKNSFNVFSLKGQKDNVSIDFEPYDNVKAPLNIGDVVGKLIVFNNGIEIGNVECIVKQKVNRKIYFDYISEVARLWGI